MRKKNLSKLITWSISALMIISLFSTCIKDSFDMEKVEMPNYQGKWAFPLVKSTLTMEQILTNHDPENLEIDSITDLLTLLYTGNLLTKKASELYQINDGFTTSSFGMTNSNITSLGSGVSITFTDTMYVDLIDSAGFGMDSIFMKSGELTLKLKSGIHHNTNVNLTFPTIKKDGVPLSNVFTLSYPTAVDDSTSFSEDLSNYKIAFDGSNKIPIYFDFNVTSTNNNPIGPTDKLEFTASFKNMEYDIIFGNIGPDLNILKIDNPANIKIFNDIIEGRFDLISPEINIYTANSFGIDISIPVDKIDYTFLNSSGASQTEGMTIFPNPLNPYLIPGPAASSWDRSLHDSLTTKHDTVTLSTANSNIRSVIASSPTFVEFGVTQVLANPSLLGRTNSFIRSDSEISIDMEVRMPLHGAAKAFTSIQYFDIDFSGDSTSVETSSEFPIKSAIIRLKVDNGFAWEMALSTWIADEDSNLILPILDSTQIISAGIIGNDEIIIGPTTTVTDIFLTPAIMDSLIENARYLVVKGGIETNDGGTVVVQMLNTYQLDLEVGILLELDANLSSDEE